METARADGTELVAVHLEILQRGRQPRDLGELVPIQVQFLQKSQVLHGRKGGRTWGRSVQRTAGPGFTATHQGRVLISHVVFLVNVAVV